MHRRTAGINTVLVFSEAYFPLHVYVVYSCSSFDKRPVKEVTVVRDEDVWLNVVYMSEELPDHSFFVFLIVDCEQSFEFGLRRVLEALYIRGNYLPVRYQVALNKLKVIDR